LYNGYEVHPQQLRTRSAGYTTCAESLEGVKKTLEQALGDGRYLGNDEYEAEFSKVYKPLLESIWKALDGGATRLHGLKHTADQMALTYENAEIASTIQV
jgi:hypothetical protein